MPRNVLCSLFCTFFLFFCTICLAALYRSGWLPLAHVVCSVSQVNRLHKIFCFVHCPHAVVTCFSSCCFLNLEWKKRERKPLSHVSEISHIIWTITKDCMWGLLIIAHQIVVCICYKWYYTLTTDINFRGFAHRVSQTFAVDVVGKGSQWVVSRSDNKYVTRHVRKLSCCHYLLAIFIYSISLVFTMHAVRGSCRQISAVRCSTLLCLLQTICSSHCNQCRIWNSCYRYHAFVVCYLSRIIRLYTYEWPKNQNKWWNINIFSATSWIKEWCI